MLWDIYCKVIDNHGDIGVCWRLAADLARRGIRVRLWVDNDSALRWMAPDGCAGVEVLAWPVGELTTPVAHVVVEAFGCELPEASQSHLAHHAAQQGQPVWINLEYLSAEPYAERSHGLPSPVQSGPAKGLFKHFYFPGFTPGTGGLLREPGLLERRIAFDARVWLQQWTRVMPAERVFSLFCYEPPALADWLRRLAQAPEVTHLLVAAGRPQAAVTALGFQSGQGALKVTYLPTLTQPEFDHLLWACDFNFVRGEDSLVRALWAQRPFVWQAYPQSDDAHHDKLHALLNTLQAPDSLQHFHRCWNGAQAGVLPDLELAEWGQSLRCAVQRLSRQDDLTTQLLGFIQKTVKIQGFAKYAPLA